MYVVCVCVCGMCVHTYTYIPKRNIIKPRRFQTTSSSVEAGIEKKTMELQDSQLEEDVAELWGVLENHSPDINMHAHSLTYAQSSDTTYSLTNAQSIVTQHNSYNTSILPQCNITLNLRTIINSHPHKHLLCTKHHNHHPTHDRIFI